MTWLSFGLHRSSASWAMEPRGGEPPPEMTGLTAAAGDLSLSLSPSGKVSSSYAFWSLCSCTFWGSTSRRIYISVCACKKKKKKKLKIPVEISADIWGDATCPAFDCAHPPSPTLAGVSHLARASWVVAYLGFLLHRSNLYGWYRTLSNPVRSPARWVVSSLDLARCIQ